MTVVTGFCPKCGTARQAGMTFCGRCGQSFDGPHDIAPVTQAPARQPASFGRILITPILTTVAGYLIFGMYGLAVGAFVGILYVMVAAKPGR